MRNNVRKITKSFPEHRYDIERTMWEWIIYFWDKEGDSFFFELPNATDPWEVEKGREGQITPRAKISVNGEWKNFENIDIDELIKNIKELI